MKVKHFVVVTWFVLSATGCISAMVSSAVDSAVDTAEARLEGRWKDDWSPVVLAKLDKEMGLLQTGLLERLDSRVKDQFDELQIDLRAHDTNGDGQLQAKEAFGLLKEMKAQNDKREQPFSLIELLAGFAAVYASGSGLKGGVRRMMAGKPEKTSETEASA